MSALKEFISVFFVSVILVGCEIVDVSSLLSSTDTEEETVVLTPNVSTALTACATVSYAIDDMAFSTGGATSDGYNIWSDGTGTVSHSFVAGENRVTVYARGEIAGGAGPNMVVRVGGTVIGDIDITDTSMQPYDFTYTATGGTEEIEVEFTNDYYGSTEDRNLIVGGIDVTCVDDNDMAWITTWVSAMQLTESYNLPPSPGLAGNTLRQNILITLGGNQLRFTFSNEYGDGPLTINGATVAWSAGGSAVATSSLTAMTFSGASSVTIPAGSSVTSDVVDLAVAPLINLSVSMYFDDTTPDDVTGHPGSRTTSYLQSGDALLAASMDSASTTDHWYFLSAVDVLTTDTARAIVTIGDSITDGRGSTTNGNDRWPNRLAERLLSNGATENIAVLNQGIGGNCVLYNCLGPSAVSRFSRDVLGPPGVEWVIILEGINDLGNIGSLTADQMIAAYTQMAETAHQAGVSVIGGTIMPCGDSSYYNETMEAKRQTINSWIRTTSMFDEVIDFDAITQDAASPTRLSDSVDSGDGLHPDSAGYRIMANAIELSLFGDTFVEENGMVVMEAESYDAAFADGATDDTWSKIVVSDASGGSCMQVGPDSTSDYHVSQTDVEVNAARMDYQVDFTTTGTWYLWVRGASTTSAGHAANSCHGGIDGTVEALFMDFADTGAYEWVQGTITVSSTGVHMVNLFMREDGFIADKIILTTDSAYAPSGIDQTESRRQ